MKKAIRSVAIIIPAYYSKSSSSQDEISISQLQKYLSKYDRYFIVPKNAKINHTFYENIKVKRFSNHFFKSPQTYNKLLLSKEFYNRFKKYNYILIYQLDALVFSDQLKKWCNSGYDYIGAPWFNSKIGWLSNKKGVPPSGGNGGFSLRKVDSFLKVLQISKKQAKRVSKNSLVQKMWFIKAVIIGKSHKIWLNAPADNYPFNEDGFWSFEAPKYLKNFKVAPFKEALKFAFERFPRKCFRLNNKKLPFGCHAWAKYDREFWLNYIIKD